MDIPDDEEELLQLESLTFEDDEFDIQIEPSSPPSSPEPPQLEKPALSLPPKPSPYKQNPGTKKRFRTDQIPKLPSGTDTFDPSVKRSKAAGKETLIEKSDRPNFPNVETLIENLENDDNDWLRYSPQPAVVEDFVAEEEKGEKILSRYATDIEGDCVPVTGLDGERVYAKICRVEMEKEERDRSSSLNGSYNGLLQESVRVLMQKAEQEEFTKALRASTEGSTEVVHSKALVTNERLWVDKYAPSSFTELLSDEQTNREVLLWLKQWDSCVFGSELKSTTDDVLYSLRRHSSGSQHFKRSDKTYFGNKREHGFSRDFPRMHNDSDKENNISQGIHEPHEKKHRTPGPPEQKILLLCGPPGLGKTTLAHVAAAHCGYRAIEINASDDRSSSTIEAKILDAIQMNSVISDSKPKCLVIDEIDGALNDGKGAVEVILKLVSADKKCDSGKKNLIHEEHSGKKSSHKKLRNSSLLRPVICICNDLYAPALRLLRQVAKVHIFVQPTVTRVVNRLKYICNKERLNTSAIALTALAEYTECDIRSCLNTLQFLNNRKEVLNVLEISSQVVGRKDVSRSAFDIWKEIFQMRKEKRARKSGNSGSSSSVSKDFDFLYSLISNRGDYDLLLDGIHENILQLRYIDPVMQKTVKCLDSLVISDINHRYIMRTQKMSLQVYQPPIAISIHNQIAQLEKINIQWPKSFQRYRTVSAERLDMFHTWHNKISPYISRHLSNKSFVEETVSPMLHILSPPTLRPVALHLLSEKEKNDWGELVNTMVSYVITYKNIKSDRLSHEDALDSFIFSFDPPLGRYVNFMGYNSCHNDLALAVKQVLVHEVEKQKIMQSSISISTHMVAEDNTRNVQSLKSQYSTLSGAKKINGANSSIPEKSGLINATSSDKLKSVEKTKKPSGGLTNFFERFRKVSKDGSKIKDSGVQKPGTSKRDSRPLLFKFNEGFTNAVKRPVRLREFLL